MVEVKLLHRGRRIMVFLRLHHHKMLEDKMHARPILGIQLPYLIMVRLCRDGERNHVNFGTLINVVHEVVNIISGQYISLLSKVSRIKELSKWMIVRLFLLLLYLWRFSERGGNLSLFSVKAWQGQYTGHMFYASLTDGTWSIFIHRPYSKLVSLTLVLCSKWNTPFVADDPATAIVILKDKSYMDWRGPRVLDLI